MFSIFHTLSGIRPCSCPSVVNIILISALMWKASSSRALTRLLIWSTFLEMKLHASARVSSRKNPKPIETKTVETSGLNNKKKLNKCSNRTFYTNNTHNNKGIHTLQLGQKIHTPNQLWFWVDLHQVHLNFQLFF